MRAAVYRRFGAPEVVQVEDVAIPTPGPDEVLIRVHASTVSAADHRTRSGEIPKGLRLLAGFSIGFLRPRRPVLGMDAAGIVEAVGSRVTRFRPGDEVIAMLGARFGGHAEYALISQNGGIAAKPANLDFADAVSVVFGGITALAFLNRVCTGPGNRVLVNGASGAVGSAAVQLAKHRGARVTAVTSAAHRDLVLRLGVDEVIDYAVSDFAANGELYDVIVDCVGNAPFERAAASVRPGGALLLVVTDRKGLFGAARQSRASGKVVSAASVPYTPESMAALSRLAGSGVIRPVIDRSYPLADIVDAHRYVDAGHKAGSVILTLA